MTELLREWILGIVAVSLLSSFSLSLAGEAPSRRIIRLMSALALLLVVVLPLKGVDLRELHTSLSAYERTYQQEAEAVSALSEELLYDLTEETLASYVKEQAAAHGIVCEAKVTVERQDGYVRPVACTVEVTGEISEAACSALREELMAALAIEEVNVTGR